MEQHDRHTEALTVRDVGNGQAGPECTVCRYRP
jgi:hypothetical protein